MNYVKVEQISRDTVTPWLTLDEITQQLNLFSDESQDTYLTSLELATRFAIEDYLGMSMFPIKYRVYYANNADSVFDLPEGSQNLYPSQAGVTINRVGYWVGATFTTLASSTYSYDASGNRVIVDGLPTDIDSDMAAPILIEYTTAANPLQTYPVIKQAALMLLTHLYNNRADTASASLKQVPFGVSTLLRPYKSLVM